MAFFGIFWGYKTNSLESLTPTTYKKSFCSGKQPQPKKGGRRKILDLQGFHGGKKSRYVAIPRESVLWSVDAILCKELWGSNNNDLTQSIEKAATFAKHHPHKKPTKTTTAMINKMSKCPKMLYVSPSTSNISCKL